MKLRAPRCREARSATLLPAVQLLQSTGGTFSVLPAFAAVPGIAAAPAGSAARAPSSVAAPAATSSVSAEAHSNRRGSFATSLVIMMERNPVGHRLDRIDA